jgi:hypothetical protein
MAGGNGLTRRFSWPMPWRDAVGVPDSRTSRFDWLRRALPAALLTCVVALYNGFPLAYPDTANYLGNAYSIAHGQQPDFFHRPLTYGLFLIPFATPLTVWLIPLAQGLLVALVVELALRGAAVSLSTRGFLALFAGLSIFTSLPWTSGQIMPDVFTGLLILLSFVTLWGHERLSQRRRLMVAGLLTVAIATHLTHLPLYGLLLVVGLAGRWVALGKSRSWRDLSAVALRGSVPLVLAAGLLMLPNYWLHREPVLSRSSSLFALAHLMGNGTAQRYLARACPTRRYLLCSELAALRTDLDWFLWAPDGPGMRYRAEPEPAGSMFLREARAIVSGTVRQEWPTIARKALRAAVVQLGTFRIHHGSADHTFSAAVAEATKRIGRAPLEAYRASEEAHDALPVTAASRAHYLAVGLSLLVILGCLPALRGPAHSPLRALIATVFAGVLLNALVTASLAAVRPRYQSRVVWLLPLTAAVAAQVAIEGRRGRLRSRHLAGAKTI